MSEVPAPISPELHESLTRGLAQSARGETFDLGDFSQYVDVLRANCDDADA